MRETRRRGPSVSVLQTIRAKRPRPRRLGDARALAGLAAGSLVCAAWAISGCDVTEVKPSACEENPELCPASSRTATDLTCDCRCDAGFSGITPTRTFEGRIAACLPPSLNPLTVTNEARPVLESMSNAEFNQRVYRYCSVDVASFLNEIIEEQQRPPELAAMCIGPRIRCSCSTAGATEQTPTCSAPCTDTTCERSNCSAILRVGGRVDASACSCSRARSCGEVTPTEGSPAMCLNRQRAIALRRQSNRSRQPRLRHTALRGLRIRQGGTSEV
jgi:hypothetical protein